MTKLALWWISGFSEDPTVINMDLYVDSNYHSRYSISIWILDDDKDSEVCLNIKMLSYQYRDPHVQDKTISRPSYL